SHLAQVRSQTAAGRDPVAPDRVLHRVLAAAPAARRRRPANARGASVRQGPGRSPGEARTEPTDLCPVLRVAPPRRPGPPRRIAVDEAAHRRGADAAAAGEPQAGLPRAPLLGLDRAAGRHPGRHSAGTPSRTTVPD